MQSRWFHLKENAINLRKQGRSIKSIEDALKIPRSTLSGWFKDVPLSKVQSKKLEESWKESLKKARKKAVLWHNQQKKERLRTAEKEATLVLNKIHNKKEIMELSLALLYLGEGFKKSPRTGIGNSDPLILKFFLKLMLNIYKIDISDIRFDLHLRADQSPEKLKEYWSKELGIAKNDFRNISIDKRTKGRKTYPEYRGVCVIDCANIAIQRKLVYIATKYCEKVVNMGG